MEVRKRVVCWRRAWWREVERRLGRRKQKDAHVALENAKETIPIPLHSRSSRSTTGWSGSFYTLDMPNGSLILVHKTG